MVIRKCFCSACRLRPLYLHRLFVQVDHEMQQRALQAGFESDEERERQVGGGVRK
jgi:hypothetical protein